jgi:hypothetical protein
VEEPPAGGGAEQPRAPLFAPVTSTVLLQPTLPGGLPKARLAPAASMKLSPSKTGPAKGSGRRGRWSGLSHGHSAPCRRGAAKNRRSPRRTCPRAFGSPPPHSRRRSPSDLIVRECSANFGRDQSVRRHCREAGGRICKGPSNDLRQIWDRRMPLSFRHIHRSLSCVSYRSWCKVHWASASVCDLVLLCRPVP